MKRLLLFTLAYFILTMAWAFPWHMIFFHDLYVSWGAFTREEPIMAFGIAAIVIQGLVIGTLYQHFRLNAHPLLRGVVFSLLIGLMVYTAMGFATAAKFKIEPVSQFLLYHTVFQFIQFVMAGLALGWIYRNQPQTA